MKDALKSLLTSLLSACSRAIVRKYKPQIVMVTGSVGKTSTKDAIAAALGKRVFLRAPEKSFNSELGVPLTIIGAKNPWGSALGWLGVLREAIALIVLPNHYPKLLVLEVGADRPGDLEKTLRIAAPDAVVVTALPEVPVHVEAYPSPDAVRDEEFGPAYALSAGAPLIINSGDEYARSYAARVSAAVYTFGFEETAGVRITDVHAGEQGMAATLVVGGAIYPLSVPGVLGRPQLLAPAAAVALARALGFSVEEALEGLARYAPPPGRMRLFEGKGGSRIIDDTYNASPTATVEALHALKQTSAKRRIAVLADMLELGRYSVQEHERIGALVAECADELVVVGVRARRSADAARAAGMDAASIHEFDDSRTAAGALSMLVQQGDVVLVKGSQSMRMERVTEALLANPADLKHLARQESEWKRR